MKNVSLSDVFAPCSAVSVAKDGMRVSKMLLLGGVQRNGVLSDIDTSYVQLAVEKLHALGVDTADHLVCDTLNREESRITGDFLDPANAPAIKEQGYDAIMACFVHDDLDMPKGERDALRAFARRNGFIQQSPHADNPQAWQNFVDAVSPPILLNVTAYDRANSVEAWLEDRIDTSQYPHVDTAKFLAKLGDGKTKLRKLDTFVRSDIQCHLSCAPRISGHAAKMALLRG